MPWTENDIADLSGKTLIVTGGNSGIGYEAARAFAQHGANVVLACRDRGRAEVAAKSIGGNVEVMVLDLASLASIRSFAEAFKSQQRPLHALVNNAGVMALPYRKTVDGFEMQFGTNHLGHFALTGLMLEPLLATPGARVVTVSSGVHKAGKIHFDDLQWERSYSKWPAYCQSKLANLLFLYELQRRLEAAGKSLISVGCHPGYAATNLQAAGPKMTGSSFTESVMEWANGVFAQSAAMGAQPTMYATTAADVRGGDYIGPSGIGELWGSPTKVRSNAASHDRAVAARLWSESEKLTGVSYPI